MTCCIYIIQKNALRKSASVYKYILNAADIKVVSFDYRGSSWLVVFCLRRNFDVNSVGYFGVYLVDKTF